MISQGAAAWRRKSYDNEPTKLSLVVWHLLAYSHSFIWLKNLFGWLNWPLCMTAVPIELLLLDEFCFFPDPRCHDPANSPPIESSQAMCTLRMLCFSVGVVVIVLYSAARDYGIHTHSLSPLLLT